MLPVNKPFPTVAGRALTLSLLAATVLALSSAYHFACAMSPLAGELRE